MYSKQKQCVYRLLASSEIGILHSDWLEREITPIVFILHCLSLPHLKIAIVKTHVALLFQFSFVWLTSATHQ